MGISGGSFRRGARRTAAVVAGAVGAALTVAVPAHAGLVPLSPIEQLATAWTSGVCPAGYGQALSDQYEQLGATADGVARMEQVLRAQAAKAPGLRAAWDETAATGVTAARVVAFETCLGVGAEAAKVFAGELPVAMSATSAGVAETDVPALLLFLVSNPDVVLAAVPRYVPAPGVQQPGTIDKVADQVETAEDDLAVDEATGSKQPKCYVHGDQPGDTMSPPRAVDGFHDGWHAFHTTGKLYGLSIYDFKFVYNKAAKCVKFGNAWHESFDGDQTAFSAWKFTDWVQNGNATTVYWGNSKGAKEAFNTARFCYVVKVPYTEIDSDCLRSDDVTAYIYGYYTGGYCMRGDTNDEDVEDQYPCPAAAEPVSEGPIDDCPLLDRFCGPVNTWPQDVAQTLEDQSVDIHTGG